MRKHLHDSPFDASVSLMEMFASIETAADVNVATNTVVATGVQVQGTDHQELLP